ncbi:MAG: TatD family hydrolase [Halobacteriota archaeon]
MDPLKYFDAHIHSEGRSIEDLITMSKNGIKAAVTCAFYPIKPHHQETMLDLFRKLMEFEIQRGVTARMNLYAAIGIHPRCIPPSVDKVLDFMECDEECVAFGEIGLENADDKEVEVFVQQLKMAKKMDKCCIIHTPQNNKDEVTEKIIGILEGLDFSPDRAIIDHASTDTVKIILHRGFMAGLTVDEGKLTMKNVAWIVETFEDYQDRLILNSDTGFGSSTVIEVAKTARLLEDMYGVDIAKKVAWSNAVNFFGV